MTALLLAAALGCGTEDWDVKTLRDPGAAEALARPVKKATIEEIGKLDPKTAVRQVYETEGWIRLVVNEDDEDKHVPVADDPASLVTEYPAAPCMPEISPDQRLVLRDALLAVTHARLELLRLRHAHRHEPIHVRVWGLLYWDKCVPGHMPLGHAPPHDGLCAELHPALRVEEITDQAPTKRAGEDRGPASPTTHETVSESGGPGSPDAGGRDR